MSESQGHRLYVKGKHLSYQRGKRNTNPDTSLIQIEGVENTKDATFYLGKRIAYVYRAKKEIRGSKIRVIWGKVTRTHGNSGVVRAQFRHNLPAKSFGAMNDNSTSVLHILIIRDLSDRHIDHCSAQFRQYIFYRPTRKRRANKSAK
ncbi:unnamed protein product [Zymoseptoria tritici ST99CH_3D7]|uniref:Uncharacterized protein n=1 Tax=Zymoseptoria tritici (strain ST99CH_3D7) TaxID=1276538 RepID=A0A1X7S0D7_ZYMT9|nr:unnamed protein product [Zymoseptoria tritici ST99CH_3D7]